MSHASKTYRSAATALVAKKTSEIPRKSTKEDSLSVRMSDNLREILKKSILTAQNMDAFLRHATEGDWHFLNNIAKRHEISPLMTPRRYDNCNMLSKPKVYQYLREKKEESLVTNTHHISQERVSVKDLLQDGTKKSINKLKALVFSPEFMKEYYTSSQSFESHSHWYILVTLLLDAAKEDYDSFQRLKQVLKRQLGDMKQPRIASVEQRKRWDEIEHLYMALNDLTRPFETKLVRHYLDQLHKF